MEPLHRTSAASRTPLAPRGGGANAPQRRRPWGWLGWVTGTVVMLAVGLAAPPPAAACSWYDPVCWVEEGVDFFKDLVVDLGDLVQDIITLDPQGAFGDLADICENLVCAKARLTLVNLIGADVAESLYNNNCDAPHGIALDALAKLRPYFNSSLESVVIHENCDFSNRNAITFGEHIYFGRPNPVIGIRGYRPMDANGHVDADGFADLAHELVHVLQYRRMGFADFICHYWPTCGIASDLAGEFAVSCGLEQQAYMHEALVREDMSKDGDGIFTCALAAQEWTPNNVAGHSCNGKPLLDNCPDVFNPGQEDSDRDGVGDACELPSDILWRHSNGQVAIWFMDGGTITGDVYPGGPDPTLSWTIQGTGDFDADGQADILWRHTNGQPAIWFIRDGAIVGQAYPGGPDPGLTWTIQGVGDFDGDGHADILWRHVSGQLAIWFQGDIAEAAYPGYHNYPWPVDLAWQVQGVGDFNGDRRADIVWRHTNGQPAIWFMDGGIRVGETVPGGQDPSLYWKIQAVSDFDGDQRADILWRAGDGTLAIWFRGEMGFDSPSYQNIPGPVDLSWRVQGLGDFNHDGRADILWRHSGGQVAIWLMDGARFVGDVYPRWVDTAWQIKGLLHAAR